MSAFRHCLLSFLLLLLATTARADKVIPVLPPDADMPVVDEFLVGESRIEVRFFNPGDFIRTFFPRYDVNDTTLTDFQLITMWDRYLQKTPSYLFTAYDRDSHILKHFCLRGVRMKERSGRTNKLEVIRGDVGVPFRPDLGGYQDAIERVIPGLRVRGMLFEHMPMFQHPDRREMVGNGVQLHGFFVRVLPYREVKELVEPIIREELLGEAPAEAPAASREGEAGDEP